MGCPVIQLLIGKIRGFTHQKLPSLFQTPTLEKEVLKCRSIETWTQISALRGRLPDHLVDRTKIYVKHNET